MKTLVKLIETDIDRIENPDFGLQLALQHVLNHFGCAAGTIHEHLPDEGRMKIRASFGIPDFVKDKVKYIAIGKGIAGAAAERMEPIQIHNIKAESCDGMVKPGAKLIGVEGSIAVPIIASGQLRGVLGIAKSEAYTFTDKEIALLEEICASLSMRMEYSLV